MRSQAVEFAGFRPVASGVLQGSRTLVKIVRGTFLLPDIVLVSVDRSGESRSSERVVEL